MTLKNYRSLFFRVSESRQESYTFPEWLKTYEVIDFSLAYKSPSRDACGHQIRGSRLIAPPDTFKVDVSGLAGSMHRCDPSQIAKRACDVAALSFETSTPPRVFPLPSEIGREPNYFGSFLLHLSTSENSAVIRQLEQYLHALTEPFPVTHGRIGYLRTDRTR